jgi:hypothetical protein
MRIFTGSSDSIGHRGTSGNFGVAVMLCEPDTDKSTLRSRVPDRGKAHEKIGSLIACKKRQRYVMLCEAVLESGDRIGWRPDGNRAVRLGQAECLVKRSLQMLADRPAIHVGHFSHGRVRNQKIKPSSKRDEVLNLFAWTRV